MFAFTIFCIAKIFLSNSGCHLWQDQKKIQEKLAKDKEKENEKIQKQKRLERLREQVKCTCTSVYQMYTIVTGTCTSIYQMYTIVILAHPRVWKKILSSESKLSYVTIMKTMYCQYCRIDHNSMNPVSQAFGINTCNKITVVF